MPQKKQSVLTYDNCIRFNSKNIKRDYLVEITIDQEDNNVSIITYNISINYATNNLVEVVTTNFLVNLVEPEATLETLALECRKALEKCEYQVNTKNEIINLENHNEILEKWTAIKQKLMQENTGELFDKYIAIFENTLQNKADLLFKLKKDIFINQYFFPIFDEPYHNLKKNNNENFTFFNFDYQQDVILEIQNDAKFDENKNIIITKKIVKNENNTVLFPLEKFETKYIVNNDFLITKILGEFINHQKKYSFIIGN